MRINKLKYSEIETNKVGLKEINLERFGSVVALIGKNGSGKSRILNFIENKFAPNIYDFINQNIVIPPLAIEETLSKLNVYQEFIQKKIDLDRIKILRQSDPNNAELKAEFRKVQTELNDIDLKLTPNQNNHFAIARTGLNAVATRKNTSQKIEEIISPVNPSIARLKADFVKKVDYNQIRQLQEAISEKEENKNSFENLIESVTDNLDYNEFGSIYSSGLRFLKKLPHQLAFDWIDCLGDSKKFEKRVAFSRYKALKDIFDNIIGKEIEWEMRNVSKNVTVNGVQSTSQGVWKINGREFNYIEFSDGEKTLFAYVLLFFLMSQNKNIRLKESIIIIDEPELHLHPDAEIDLITGIRNIIEDKGQLWIATHSINILSHLHFEEVFIVKDGNIIHPTKTIQRQALAELMKIEDRVEKLSEFINSITDWTFVQFMIECFKDPEVIEIAKENDPQIKSLKQFISNPKDEKKKVLLDFGAGKGRLYDQLKNDEVFQSKIEYSAFEPDVKLHPALKMKGVKEAYYSYDNIQNNKFDFVVLCNVLHEINIDEWLGTLNGIINILSEHGSLIIIEAKSLVKGEKIGDTGFILLEEDEIELLFNLKEKPLSMKHKEEFQNITSVLLPKSTLTNVTKDSILLALQKLEEKCLTRIEINRKEDKSRDINSNFLGRQSAFLSQQYINTKLALKHINKSKH